MLTLVRVRTEQRGLYTALISNEDDAKKVTFDLEVQGKRVIANHECLVFFLPLCRLCFPMTTDPRLPPVSPPPDQRPDGPSPPREETLGDLRGRGSAGAEHPVVQLRQHAQVGLSTSEWTLGG